MHIEFDIEESKMRYDTGDHVGVYPKNSTELVNKIGELLNTDLDTVFSLLNTDGMIISKQFILLDILCELIYLVIYTCYRGI